MEDILKYIYIFGIYKYLIDGSLKNNFRENIFIKNILNKNIIKHILKIRFTVILEIVFNFYNTLLIKIFKW